MVRQWLHRDAGREGAVGDGGVVDAVREADEQVQAGGDAVDARAGQVRAQGVEQRVAAACAGGRGPSAGAARSSRR